MRGFRLPGVFALLAAVACAGPALGAFYQDFWPASADGNMDTYDGSWDSGTGDWVYPPEGYAIAGEGNYRFTRWDQHFPFVDFDIESDGPDHESTRTDIAGGDPIDGQKVADWLVGKKIVSCGFYFRSAAFGFCTNLDPPGVNFQEDEELILFRTANDGRFVDRSDQGNGFTGCCASYDAPLLEGGENAPPAWRMGPPPYSAPGDAGVGAVWYKVSTADSANPGQEVHAGNPALVPPFDGDGDGLGGYSGPMDQPGDDTSNEELWAFEYIVRHSDALIVNSDTLTADDCTDALGGFTSPRHDYHGWVSAGPGWYGVPLDRTFVKAYATLPDVKGMILSGLNGGADASADNSIQGWDQSPSNNGPYLHIIATLAGDVNNDGIVNSFGSTPGDPNWNEEADFDLNGAVNVFDVISLVNNFGNCVPEPPA